MNITGIVGKNGSGKSSLIEYMSLIFDNNINELESKKRNYFLITKEKIYNKTEFKIKYDNEIIEPEDSNIVGITPIYFSNNFEGIPKFNRIEFDLSPDAILKKLKDNGSKDLIFNESSLKTIFQTMQR